MQTYYRMIGMYVSHTPPVINDQYLHLHWSFKMLQDQYLYVFIDRLLASLQDQYLMQVLVGDEVYTH
ncbi:MAG: hypothetical protein VXY56_09905 [Pseudomonadota bacterium]|nr:hypothetical protein [Pseudomonadota bacterium]